MGSGLFTILMPMWTAHMKRCVHNSGAKQVSDFMNGTKTILCMDLGATNMRNTFVEVAHNLESFAFEKTGEIFLGAYTPDRLVAYIATRLKTVKTVPLAITLRVTSTVDRSNKVIFLP